MGGNSGMLLIGIVFAMVVFAILGVAAVKMFSTSSMNEVSANLAHKAQYMAESGFRYAASQYRNLLVGEAKDDILIDINTCSTYPLSPYPPGYELTISSYFYKYIPDIYPASPVGTAFGTVPTEILNYTGTVGTGKVGIFKSGFLTHIGTFSGYTKAPTAITFTGTVWSPSVPPSGESRLFPVVSPATGSSQTITFGGSINLNTTNNDLSLLPAKNGPFRIYTEDKFAKYEDLLKYKELDLDTTNKRLIGISRINGSTATVKIAPTDYIVLQRFIHLDSTGKVGDVTSNIFASRRIAYEVPIEAFSASGVGGGGGGPDNILEIPVADKKLMNDPEFTVSPDIQTAEAVLQATGPNTGDTNHGISTNTALSLNLPSGYDNVHVNINWWRFVDRNLGLNFDQAYHVQGDSLSYDMQLKIRTTKLLHHFMVGVSFRMTNNNVGHAGNAYYGASLFSSISEPNNKLGNYPPWLGIPTSQGGTDSENGLADLPKGPVYVVFWKRVDGGKPILLNAQEVPALTADPYNEDAYLVDWASVVVRIEEPVSGTRTNNLKILVYNNNENVLQTITWPTETVWNGLASGMNPPVIITSDSTITTPVSGHIPVPTKDADGNYLPECESCISCVGVCGWPEIGLHAFADVGADSKIFVDDFSVKLLGGGNPAGGDVGFQPPVYTP
jgi:hypothetical protein